MIDVIETTQVTKVAAEQLGLNPDGSIRSISMDARQAIEDMPEARSTI